MSSKDRAVRRKYEFSKTVSRRLWAWAWFSIGTGLGLLGLRHKFWRGVSLHFISWGVIDGLIAAVGMKNADKKLSGTPSTKEANDDHRKLRRLLWINSLLDVGYVAGGVWLFQKKGEDDAYWRGQGIGVLIQGGFLLLFDLIHALLAGRK